MLEFMRNLFCTGPTLRFMVAGVASICGAEFGAEVDGKQVPLWQSFAVPKGSTLTVASVRPLRLISSYQCPAKQPVAYSTKASSRMQVSLCSGRDSTTLLVLVGVRIK